MKDFKILIPLHQIQDHHLNPQFSLHLQPFQTLLQLLSPPLGDQLDLSYCESEVLLD